MVGGKIKIKIKLCYNYIVKTNLGKFTNQVEDVLTHWAIRGLYSASRTLMPFETKVNYNDPLSRV